MDDLYSNTGKPYTKEDLDYLINWYDKIGLEEMSLALERTGRSVVGKVYELRKGGKMKKAPQKRRHHSRTFTDADIIRIVDARRSNMSYRKIAAMFHADTSTIYKTIKKATKNPDQKILYSMC